MEMNMTRRGILAGTGAACLAAMPVLAGDDPDAELKRLFSEWIAVQRYWNSLPSEGCDAEEDILCDRAADLVCAIAHIPANILEDFLQQLSVFFHSGCSSLQMGAVTRRAAALSLHFSV